MTTNTQTNTTKKELMEVTGPPKNMTEWIQIVPLAEIDEFPNHPYQVRMDQDMVELAESVKERGVISPVILRRMENGRYQMISGHRRKKACELARLTTIPADVRDLTDDEATMLMVQSNLHRSKLLPSEKARAYKMQMEAIKRQGARTDLSSCPPGTRWRSDEQLAAAAEDSARQIQRYIRLNELIPGLLELVDEGSMGLRPAVEVSYLKPEEQETMLESIQEVGFTPSLSQALQLKDLSQEGKLTDELIKAFIEVPKETNTFTMRADLLWKYIPKHISRQDTETIILKALAYYKKYCEQQRKKEQERCAMRR